MDRTLKPTLTIVCENYWPEYASTGQLITQLAEGLTDHFEVEVLTAQPRYHGTYERRPRTEWRNGVAVRRLFTTRFSKTSGAGRIANWLSFLLAAGVGTSLRWRNRTYLFVTNPPTAPWALLIANLVGHRSYVLVYDLYPDLAEALGAVPRRGLAARAFDLVNRLAMRRATGLIAVGTDMARRIETKLGGSVEVQVLPNWADEGHIRPGTNQPSEFARRHGLEDRSVFLYAGNLGRFQDLETLVEAVESLDGNWDREPVLVFVGNGEKRRRVEELARGSRRIQVHDYVPYEELGDLYRAASVGLIALEPGVEQTNVPSKTYAIMAAGLPFLAVCEGSTDLSALAADGCGVCVPNDARQVAAAMTRFLDNEQHRADAGDAARRTFEERFSKAAAIERYRRVLTPSIPANASEREVTA